MKTKDYSVPKGVQDLRIRHFKPLTNPVYEGQLSPRMMCEFVSDFLGIHVNEVLKIDIKDVLKIFNHAKQLYADIGIGTPPKYLTMGGTEYELVNPKKVGVGWHIDFSHGEIEADPIWLACLFYYPKGIKYGETDANANLIYPIKDRYNVFEREMDLQTFMNASAFFLTKTEKSMTLSMAKQKVQISLLKVLRPSSGKQSLTS